MKTTMGLTLALTLVGAAWATSGCSDDSTARSDGAARDASVQDARLSDSGDAAPPDTTLGADQAPCSQPTQVVITSGYVCRTSCGEAVACKSLTDSSAKLLSPTGWTDIDLLVAGRDATGHGGLVGRRSSGEVVAYSLNTDQQEVVAVQNVETLTAGDSHFCVQHKDNTASCWGRQDAGQFGLGFNPGTPAPASQPVVLPEKNILAIAAGGTATCVIRANKTVACAGTLSKQSNASFEVITALGSDAQQIYVGGIEGTAEACAVDSTGKLTCTHGKFTPPATAAAPTSITVTDLSMCAVLAGELRCAGEAWDTATKVWVSVEPTGLPDVVSVVANHGYFCAVTTGAEVWCWGGAAWEAVPTRMWP